MFGPWLSGKLRASKVRSQYSLRDSPFHAKTFAVPAAAIAEAAWS